MSDINKKNLEAIGFIGSESDMVWPIPNGHESELHIEKVRCREEYNILFTRGTIIGVPGKDYDYVYAGPAKSIDQIKQLVNLLIQ
ncbi:hypothetical protein SAMN04489761_4264 [Tenacibaculum sp. MAR_2009_124]|uniref:hypothetical protein n=1 Tax=Tenacibaculum sp. MAR_2009_124 TaxID=1250059 RepID=UPI0008976FA9|nr:hypothetical protein [Tenacibaculum sp. MAR_2009_124]SED09748.1 hypothetical protein SAMN04489761_4264 [Tenacibaculum sp. MAR_2009_124]